MLPKLTFILKQFTYKILIKEISKYHFLLLYKIRSTVVKYNYEIEYILTIYSS